MAVFPVSSGDKDGKIKTESDSMGDREKWSWGRNNRIRSVSNIPSMMNFHDGYDKNFIIHTNEKGRTFSGVSTLFSVLTSALVSDMISPIVCNFQEYSEKTPTTQTSLTWPQRRNFPENTKRLIKFVIRHYESRWRLAWVTWSFFSFVI